MKEYRKEVTDIDIDNYFETITRMKGWELNWLDMLVICKCGTEIEADAKECPDCKCKNPFVQAGII